MKLFDWFLVVLSAWYTFYLWVGIATIPTHLMKIPKVEAHIMKQISRRTLYLAVAVGFLLWRLS